MTVMTLLMMMTLLMTRVLARTASRATNHHILEFCAVLFPRAYRRESVGFSSPTGVAGYGEAEAESQTVDLDEPKS